MAVKVEKADFKSLDRHFDDLRQTRISTGRDAEFQLIADVFLPRKDFMLPQKPTELRRRRLTSSVPAVQLRRGAGLGMAYAISNTRPFIKPNVARGLVAAGRRTELESEAITYLSDTEWSVFDAMMLPQSGFVSSSARMWLELYAFGTAIQWVGRKRGFGASYQTRPLRACWIEEGEDQKVETNFFQFTLPLWKAVMRWPDHGVDKWTRAMADDNPAKARDHVTIVHAVYPRRGGEAGAFAEAKPWAEVYFCRDEKVILAERGYDSFPYAVPRLDVEDGSAYGTGLAWWVLPEALVLHSLQQGVETAVELKNNPPLMVPKRMFGKALDRRAGSVNQYDAAGLGFQNASQAIQKLDIAGNVEVAAAYMERLEGNIERAFFTDWMTLRDASNVTAEEIRDRRDLRIRAMSSFVPGIDRDWMGPVADRTLEVIAEEGMLKRPPPQLGGVDVDWDYNGPLAIAQQAGQVESIQRAHQMAMVARDIDPSSVYVYAIEEGLRAAGEALALPPETMRSRTQVAEMRARDEQARAMAENAEMMKQAGQALQASGQGAANLATADQIQQGGRMAA
ncbi:portal protein [Phenylobacterium sp.]|jgi:hypothetical protein|uniref:portal protein n=1 Tax=Phenylobacterium sp. TaxID=1871053 RepID=UPI0037C77495